MTRILGISGSLRRDSHNTSLLRAAAEAAGPDIEFVLYDGLKQIPPYDEDDDVDPRPESVARLNEAIAAADAVFFSTPEYNSSIPGQLKNAIDWVSRPVATNALRNKPVAVVGASTGGFGAVWAQAELRKVLAAVGARVLDLELPVPHAHTRFEDGGPDRRRDPDPPRGSDRGPGRRSSSARRSKSRRLMRIDASATAITWLPFAALDGIPLIPLELAVAHYDEPPPETVPDIDELRRQDAFREANELRAWIEVDGGRGPRLRADRQEPDRRRAGARVAAGLLPCCRVSGDPAGAEVGDGWVRFTQTVGGRIGLPAHRPVVGRPYFHVGAVSAWTTLEL
jgi:chromate reductase